MESPPQPPILNPGPAQHSVPLDALRGAAAILVLLSHWRNLFFVDYRQIPHPSPLIKSAWFLTGLGHEAVVVFFVLSGYLVGGSVLRSQAQGRWSWRSYLSARLTRLYIVLIPALILGGLLDWAGIRLHGSETLYSGQSGIETLQANVHQTLTLPALAGNLLYLQDLPGLALHFHIPTLGSNGPLWSLSLEFWCYLAFPLLLLTLAKSQSWSIRILHASAFCACAVIVGLPAAALCATWLLGALLAWLPPIRLPHPRQRRFAVASAFSLFLAVLLLDKSLSIPIPVLAFPLGLAIAILVWTLLHCATGPIPAPVPWLSQHAARFAYTLYLVHLPALLFLKAWLYLPQAYPEWRALLLPSALLIAVLLYAQAVYACFESQTDHLRNWLRARSVPRL